eukprot:jgi/Ulvmu1/6572/UM003_0209.1
MMGHEHAERNAFVHDHRCKSAPTSPLPRASPSRSPTSFGMKFASPTPIDYDCPSRGSELDCHAHFDASVPSAGHGMHKSVPPCASEVPALTMGRIRPPPLALHFLKAAKCPASACVAGSSFPLQLRMKLDQPKHDDSNHDNGPLLGSTNLGGSARQDLRVGEDDSRCAMEQTGGGIWMSDQKCPTDMETIGMEHNPCGALTFRDMLGNDLQHDAQLPGNALSPEAYEEAGAVTFRDMLGLQDKQKLNSGTAPTIEDSSAHSTNTLQADTSSRISAHGTLGPAGTGRSPAATESMLAPQLTFRDMLQMSPSCMGDSRGAPASAMSTASLVPSAGISDVTFGSSPYSPGLTWSEADYDNASLSDLADLPDNGTADGANAVLDAAVLGAVRAPGFQLQGMEHMQAAHNSTAHNSTAHNSTAHNSTAHNSTAHNSTAGATVASLRSAVQLRNPYLQDAAVALHMGGSNSTSATSSHCNSAASTPKRKFTEMKNQDDPIQGTEHALLSIQPCNTTLVHHPSASATMLEAQSAPCVRSATAVTAGHAVQGTRPKAAPARFISPELRKSCALIDLAVLCPPSCPCEPALSTVDERADMKQPLSSGSVVLHSSGSSMDTSPETESVVTGDENDAPQSGLTIPDHVEQGVYGSVESVPCTEDAEPESSYESPRSLLPTPGCKPPPPLSAEHLAALREGSDRVARTVQKDSLECDIDLHSPHQPMLWPGDSAHGCVDESPCMRMSPSLAPVGAPCGEDATARSREAGKSEDDRGSGGSLCGVKNVADSTSLPLSGDACLSSGGTCSSTDTGCTDCSSSSGEAFSGHENKCPNAEASKDMPDVIPDTPTSSEGDERESEAMEPIAAEALCAGQDGDGTLREVLGNSDADGGGLACGGQRGETSTSLTSDELNAWKQHHCSAPLVQATDGDSLVVLTNTLLRTAFREQRRADRPRGTPRWKFLGEPLDACILDTLAGPLAAAATAAPTSSDTTQSVEEFVAQTLPPMLRLSHSFAAWRYAMCAPQTVLRLSTPHMGVIWHM